MKHLDEMGEPFGNEPPKVHKTKSTQSIEQEAIMQLLKRVEALADKSERLESERTDLRAAAQQLLRSERSLSKGLLDFLVRCAQ